jgi:uncharacterized protein (DUF1778 family)
MNQVKVVKSHIGKVFQLIKEQGEDTRLYAEFRHADGALFASYDADHVDQDGYGGMVGVFQRLGVAFEAPAAKPAGPPSRLARAAALARYAMRRRQPALQLRKREPNWRAAKHCVQVGRVLSRARTSELLQRAKASKATLSSFVLHALNRSVSPQVVEDASAVTWALPVNMRGPLRVEPELGNCSSLVLVPIEANAAPHDIDRTVRKLLAQGAHWAKWDQMNFMLGSSERTARKQLESYYLKPDLARIGVFSNMAIWKADLPDDVGMLAFGAATLVDPLFASAGTLNGRLGLGLRVHPSLGASQAEVERWFAAWEDALGVREDVAHASSAVAAP